ncbi:MAG TPA: hypothetical protein VMW67_08155 [Desulfobacteria bacterium]|nr:hypothetical protein [Desulfobacteria bacterium]
MDATGEHRIWEELKAIREELEYIKAHMVDADTILTPDEEALLEAALTEFEAGKATKLKDAFERELKE